ncbi:hypothetical protein Kpol_1032p27 [Vanderwaltozyma polyspora DSM 70294]|uniref:BSD domain-containing protein n=1 Tax=Vanderwaltozyma polyspora (strain ATCC 22028 / DSM 70294 / BCRC 21397 / CBS 2163 / NBRC 10782 / NRRL Y-8283 / UCD 57-17) TaxID=436907 RepID=A7TGY2_VANPO|nr:uncharacterized protein Kpol_1032p27 [Vanderwaltozyma polyspora DSM 70294]EDO18434.1 hypothetical protein Kpol_1032p27 [Vanderwaltozyma polyspora DSM 70294]
MEFVYDETAANAASGEDINEHKVQQDEKTEQMFNKLEQEVNKQYEKTTETLQKYIQEDEEGIHINIPIEGAVAEKAQEYLQSLDANLQNVETAAQGYWNKVSNTGFWSSVSDTLSSKLDQVVQLGTEAVNSGLSPEETIKDSGTPVAVAGNRTEAELRELVTNEKIYTENKLSLDENFDVDSKTDEISKILEGNVELSNLMNTLVPQSVPYKDFWNIYFAQKTKILEMEDKRKKILESKSTEKEMSGWDDDEDEEEQPVIVQKEEVMELETKAEETKNKKAAKNKNKQTNKEKKKDKKSNKKQEKSVKEEEPKVEEPKVEEPKVEEPKVEEKPIEKVAASVEEEEDDDDDDWE